MMKSLKETCTQNLQVMQAAENELCFLVCTQEIPYTFENSKKVFVCQSWMSVWMTLCGVILNRPWACLPWPSWWNTFSSCCQNGVNCTSLCVPNELSIVCLFHQTPAYILLCIGLFETCEEKNECNIVIINPTRKLLYDQNITGSCSKFIGI